MFDTREYLQSQEAPEFIAADGTHYVGRVLSMPQWQKFEHRIELAKNKKLEWKQLQKLIFDLCDAFFPPEGSFWAHVVGRRHTVRWHVQRLPPNGQQMALWDFMRSQARAVGVNLPATPGAPKKTMTLIDDASPERSTIPTPTPRSVGSSVAG